MGPSAASKSESAFPCMWEIIPDRTSFWWNWNQSGTQPRNSAEQVLMNILYPCSPSTHEHLFFNLVVQVLMNVLYPCGPGTHEHPLSFWSRCSWASFILVVQVVMSILYPNGLGVHEHPLFLWSRCSWTSFILVVQMLMNVFLSLWSRCLWASFILVVHVLMNILYPCGPGAHQCSLSLWYWATASCPGKRVPLLQCGSSVTMHCFSKY